MWERDKVCLKLEGFAQTSSKSEFRRVVLMGIKMTDEQAKGYAKEMIALAKKHNLYMVPKKKQKKS